MVKRFRMIAGPNGSGKSTHKMLFLGKYDAESGWSFSMPTDALPAWFVRVI